MCSWGWRKLLLASMLVMAVCGMSVAEVKAAVITGLRQLEGGDTPRFDIRLDQAAHFEAYPMPQVLRYVVDLHRTEPGMVSNLTKLDTPTIKRVLLQQKDLNGLHITRVVFDLSRQMVGRVIADEDGKRLLVAFAPPSTTTPMQPAPSPAAYPAEPMPTPSTSLVNQLPPQQKKKLAPLVPETPPPTPIQTPITTARVVPAPTTFVKMPAPAASPRPASGASPQLTAVKVEDDGVLLVISGEIGQYSSVVYRKPDRLALDLVKTSTRILKPVTINRFGIRMVRIGENAERLRMVFDAAGAAIGDYEVRKVDAGLKIIFSRKTAMKHVAAIPKQAGRKAEAENAVKDGGVENSSVDRSAPLVVQAIVVESAGIRIELAGSPNPYLVETLRKPGRLVIDLPAGTARTASTVPVNRFGIRAVRVGVSPQHVRLVFDAIGDVITAHEIERVSNGLRVIFPRR